MLANIPYREARGALFETGERCIGTSEKRVLKALDALGLPHEPRFRKFRAWEDIPGDALVGIRWKDLPKSDPGHWVVLQKLSDGFRVLDPAAFADTLSVADTSDMIGANFLLVEIARRKKSPSKRAASRAKRASGSEGARPSAKRRTVKRTPAKKAS
jgi:hypothetical protein